MTSTVPEDSALAPTASPPDIDDRRQDGSARGVVTGLVIDLGVGVVVGWLLVVTGSIVVAVGFARVSTGDSLAEQLAYFSSGCIGGIVLIGIGACMVLTRQYADLRTAAEQTRELIRLRQTGVEVGDRAEGIDAGPTSSGDVVVARGSATFHAPGCIFVAGRADVRRIPARSPELVNMHSCQLCMSAS